MKSSACGIVIVRITIAVEVAGKYFKTSDQQKIIKKLLWTLEANLDCRGDFVWIWSGCSGVHKVTRAPLFFRKMFRFSRLFYSGFKEAFELF